MKDIRSAASLRGTVALVTGGSRGVGKGIALALGEVGATVYVTGRTLGRGHFPWPGSLEETVEEIDRRGGRGIAVVCDHADDRSVADAVERVRRDTAGGIDLLVNNVFAAPASMPTGQPFWELDEDLWDSLMRVGLRSHYVTSRLVAPLMVARRKGLIISTSSGGAVRYTFNVPFGVQKAGVNKLAIDMAVDLRPYGVCSIVVWPGFVKSEKLLAQPERVPAPLARRILESGESAEFVGRAVVALAGDPEVLTKSGQLLLAAELAQEYGFTDIDGRLPPTPSRYA